MNWTKRKFKKRNTPERQQIYMGTFIVRVSPENTVAVINKYILLVDNNGVKFTHEDFDRHKIYALFNDYKDRYRQQTGLSMNAYVSQSGDWFTFWGGNDRENRAFRDNPYIGLRGLPIKAAL